MAASSSRRRSRISSRSLAAYSKRSSSAATSISSSSSTSIFEICSGDIWSSASRRRFRRVLARPGTLESIERKSLMSEIPFLTVSGVIPCSSL